MGAAISPVAACEVNAASRDEVDTDEIVVITGGDDSPLGSEAPEAGRDVKIRKRMKEEAIDVNAMELSGRWKSRSGELQCIGIGQIQWNDGTVSQLRQRLKGFIVEVNGVTYHVVAISPSQLLWSDGDIWVRDAAMPSTPSLRKCAIGAEVVGQGMSGISGVLLGYVGLGSCAFGKVRHDTDTSIFETAPMEPSPWDQVTLDKLASPFPKKQTKRKAPQPRPKQQSLSSRARSQRDSNCSSLQSTLEE